MRFAVKAEFIELFLASIYFAARAESSEPLLGSI